MGRQQVILGIPKAGECGVVEWVLALICGQIFTTFMWDLSFLIQDHSRDFCDVDWSFYSFKEFPVFFPRGVF